MHFDATRPIYLQIIELHERDLMSGELKAGDKILSQRDFAKQYNVNPNTVQRAYREMETQGLVQTLRGQGTFVVANEETLSKMKQQTTDDILRLFCHQMKALGYSLEQALILAKDAWQEKE